MSPTRQKGNAYLGDVPWLDGAVRGGFSPAVAALPDAGSRTFFAQRFRPSEWYDAYPGALLELTAARLRGVPFARHRRETGHYHAEHAARGIYGALLRMVSNESVALWGPRIATLYFEFGKTETKTVGDAHVIATRSGVPRDLVQWNAYVMQAFAERTLALAGARDPVCSLGEVIVERQIGGREVCSFALEMRWRR
jgi:hypothetical protein